MINKEIEELLKFLKEPFSKEKTHKAIDKKDTKLLLSYIEQLELLKEKYQLEKECYKIKINKAIEYILGNFTNKNGTIWHSEIKNIYDILKEKK